MRCMTTRFQFNLRELAGAFGDLGVALPLLVGMQAVAGFDGVRLCVVFGLMQVFAALCYGIPVPAQPLKVVAALTIAGGLAPELVFGAGFSIGLAMLLLTVTGTVEWVARAVPKCVVRGIQFGLALKLGVVAAGYMGSGGAEGWLFSAGSLVLIAVLRRSRTVPPALIIVAAGMVFGWASGTFSSGATVTAPTVPDLVRLPGLRHVAEGFLILGLAQIPLSLGNSVLATRQVCADLYPGRGVTARKIGLTYSVMNLVSPLVGGIPVCHGSGGVVGMHLFGGRSGGAPLLSGLFFIGLGIAMGQAPGAMLVLFPLPMLGALLAAEAFALGALVRDAGEEAGDSALALAVGLCAVTLPYGFLVGMGLGTAAAKVVRPRLLKPGPGIRAGRPARSRTLKTASNA